MLWKQLGVLKIEPCPRLGIRYRASWIFCAGFIIAMNGAQPDHHISRFCRALASQGQVYRGSLRVPFTASFFDPIAQLSRILGSICSSGSCLDASSPYIEFSSGTDSLTTPTAQQRTTCGSAQNLYRTYDIVSVAAGNGRTKRTKLTYPLSEAAKGEPILKKGFRSSSRRSRAE